jgi:hypothetical protein
MFVRRMFVHRLLLISNDIQIRAHSRILVDSPMPETHRRNRCRAFVPAPVHLPVLWVHCSAAARDRETDFSDDRNLSWSCIVFVSEFVRRAQEKGKRCIDVIDMQNARSDVVVILVCTWERMVLRHIL